VASAITPGPCKQIQPSALWKPSKQEPTCAKLCQSHYKSYGMICPVTPIVNQAGFIFALTSSTIPVCTQDSLTWLQVHETVKLLHLSMFCNWPNSQHDYRTHVHKGSLFMGESNTNRTCLDILPSNLTSHMQSLPKTSLVCAVLWWDIQSLEKDDI
jgi:hypothetical protein